MTKCECGAHVWPWQRRAFDIEVGWIHAECGNDTPTDFDWGYMPRTRRLAHIRLDTPESVRRAFSLGVGYALAGENVIPNYSTMDTSAEATEFWEGCHWANRKLDLLVDRMFGPTSSGLGDDRG